MTQKQGPPTKAQSFSEAPDRPRPEGTIKHLGGQAKSLVCASSANQTQMGWRPWGIGGSDVGALLGLSSFRNPVDVWLEKVHSKSHWLTPAALPMRLGNYLEPFVVQEYERVTGNTTWALTGAFKHSKYPELFGHVDRIVKTHEQQSGPPACGSGHNVVLECKTSSAFRASEWGPAWSDQVPADYLAQCLWYLGLADCEEAHLAVLLGNTDFRVYRIMRDRQLERHMFEIAHKFWVDHVLTRLPPAAKTRAQAESLHPAQVEGLSHEAQPSTLEALRRRGKLETELALIQTQIEELKDSVAVSMGPAERITWHGQTLASWRLSKGADRLGTERLRRERPDIVADFTVTSLGTRRLHINTAALDKPSTKELR